MAGLKGIGRGIGRFLGIGGGPPKTLSQEQYDMAVAGGGGTQPYTQMPNTQMPGAPMAPGGGYGGGFSPAPMTPPPPVGGFGGGAGTGYSPPQAGAGFEMPSIGGIGRGVGDVVSGIGRWVADNPEVAASLISAIPSAYGAYSEGRAQDREAALTEEEKQRQWEDEERRRLVARDIYTERSGGANPWAGAGGR